MKTRPTRSVILVKNFEKPAAVPTSCPSILLSVVKYKTHCDVVLITTYDQEDILPNGSKRRYFKSFYDRWPCCPSATTAENTERWVERRYEFKRGSYIYYGWYATNKTIFLASANQDSYASHPPINDPKPTGRKACHDAAIQFLEKLHAQQNIDGNGPAHIDDEDAPEEDEDNNDEEDEDIDENEDDDDEEAQTAPSVLTAKIQARVSAWSKLVDRGIDWLATTTAAELESLEKGLSVSRHDPGNYWERLNILQKEILQFAQKERESSQSVYWFAKHQATCSQTFQYEFLGNGEEVDVYKQEYEKRKITATILINRIVNELVPYFGIHALRLYSIFAGKRSHTLSYTTH